MVSCGTLTDLSVRLSVAPELELAAERLPADPETGESLQDSQEAYPDESAWESCRGG